MGAGHTGSKRVDCLPSWSCEMRMKAPANMIPTPRHQVINFAQSVLLLVGMAVIGWVVVSAIAGREAAVVIVAGSVGGLLFASRVPKRILLSAYRARPLSSLDFPEGVAVLSELARRAGLRRLPELRHGVKAKE